MRVVGGAWGGRPLQAPAGRNTRPTSDKVREAVFDVLGALPEARAAALAGTAASAGPGAGEPATAGHDAAGYGDAGESAPATEPTGPLAGHAVLDVFAGSGALGIEALSRGAATCTFVEAAPPALRALRGNLERLGVPVVRAAGAQRPQASAAGPRAVVLGADVRHALAADARRGARYTLVFADPPYDAYEQVRPALVEIARAGARPRRGAGRRVRRRHGGRVALARRTGETLR